MSSDQNHVQEIIQGNVAFTNKLYQILSRKPGNVFFSPFSLYVILAMAYQATGTETLESIQKVLEIPDPLNTAIGYKQIIRNLTSLKNGFLHTAFKIYLDKEKQLLPSFASTVKEYFDSEVELADFKKPTETAKTVNEWVAEKTHGKIRQIVTERSVESSCLFLLNALYFKGDWDSPFSENKTREMPFYLNDESVVQVQMMTGIKNASYKFDEQLNCQILVLPYCDNGIKMAIILPEEKNGIGNLEAALSQMNLSEIFTNLRRRKVDVSLPKFKFETSIELNDVVKEMGLAVMYDEVNADFKKMIRLGVGQNVYVSKILQKACIEVNEKGAEAAAVTVIEMQVEVCCTDVVKSNYKFVVDHPAIFMIVAGKPKNTNILFYGRLYHPKY
ncbi:antichymotrypsin-2-like [Zophobas morio]|uniref:antichymotrypsin-2-like n=1 Tax=Zophobas morio TaxID=2755281 RepID=UPI003083A850